MGRSRAGIVLLALGAFLLAIPILGRWTALGRYESFPTRPWERFDPALAKATPDLESLYRAAQARAPRPFREMAPADAMQALYETVADRFTHGDRATYSPFGNWILWARGFEVRRYRDIEDPDALLRGGYSALCEDVSFVLLRLAGMAGIPARHALLYGHVIMEAWYGGSWHAYDPDIEVVARDDTGEVASVETLIRRADLIRRSYSGRGDPAYVERVVEIYTSTDNNKYRTYPEDPDLSTPGQRPARAEREAHYAVFLLPGALIVAGATLIAAGGRRRRSAP